MTDDAILLDTVTKSFRATRAVSDLSLAVPRGSLCGFLGPNGAGKSTTIRMIMSIIHPDQGSIRVLGGDALTSKDRIGYLPEERGLYRKMRVGEFLEYIARLKGRRAQGLRREVGDWLERVELPGVARKHCQELSKGMQQKVQFLAAVIHDPELLILDEPFSGLDPVNTKLINGLISELHRRGKTILFSTHILHQAEQICERILLLHHGHKLLDSTLAEIHERFDPRTIQLEPLGSIDPSTLAGLPGVVKVWSRENGAGFELALADDADGQATLRAAVDRHALRSIELTRPTLEEIFVRLVMRAGGADEAERAREELSHV